MRLTVQTFLTTDGVMQGPGGAEEDPRNGFDRGGWLMPYADADMGRIVDGWFATCAAVLLGRYTFGVMKPYWTQVTDEDNVVARALNGGRKYVVSSTLTDPDWGDTTVIDLDGVRRLKQSGGDGELQVHGSARLAASLHEAGLVDEYRLLRFPVCVGSGARLFTESAPPTGLHLEHSEVTSTGAVYTVLTPTPFTSGTAVVADGKEVHETPS